MTHVEMISRLRRHGFTQAQIAKKIGRSQAIVSDIERGVSKQCLSSTAAAIQKLYDATFKSKRTA